MGPVRWRDRVEKPEEKEYRVRLFPEGMPRAVRRAYIGYVIYFVVVLLCTVWPVYLIGNRVEPYVLGTPFSMFWIILVLIASLLGLAHLYRFEQRRKE